jgi:hypothetical protein
MGFGHQSRKTLSTPWRSKAALESGTACSTGYSSLAKTCDRGKQDQASPRGKTEVEQPLYSSVQARAPCLLSFFCVCSRRLPGQSLG